MMYDLIQHIQQRFIGEEMFDDDSEYDEYLMWHNTSSECVMVRVNDPYQVSGIRYCSHNPHRKLIRSSDP